MVVVKEGEKEKKRGGGRRPNNKKKGLRGGKGSNSVYGKLDPDWDLSSEETLDLLGKRISEEVILKAFGMDKLCMDD